MLSYDVRGVYGEKDKEGDDILRSGKCLKDHHVNNEPDTQRRLIKGLRNFSESGDGVVL